MLGVYVDNSFSVMLRHRWSCLGISVYMLGMFLWCRYNYYITSETRGLWREMMGSHEPNYNRDSGPYDRVAPPTSVDCLDFLSHRVNGYPPECVQLDR
jgi:hypothetical protein